jgi:hypothetical protein
MAIIDPEGLFHGERLAACSDIAQLYWPRFFLAANGFARMELSYSSIISKIFGNFRKAPEAADIWSVFEEYARHCLVILYEHEGVWWAQFHTSSKYLPRYTTTRDRKSPSPTAQALERHQAEYIKWKSANSVKNESFRKNQVDFGKFLQERSGVGVGEGEGVGVGKNTFVDLDETEIRPEPVPPTPSHPDEKSQLREAVERVFGFYCHKLDRNPKRYSLTDARREKAIARMRERVKVHDGDLQLAEADLARAVENLAASDFHQSGGYIDWIDQIFKSEDEFQKRLNWAKPTGGNTNGKPGREQHVVGIAQEYAEKLIREAMAQPALGRGGVDEAEPAAGQICP